MKICLLFFLIVLLVGCGPKYKTEYVLRSGKCYEVVKSKKYAVETLSNPINCVGVR